MATFTATLRVRGFAELDRSLSRLPDIVEERIMRDALEASGDIILKAAQENIHSRTGKTAADIRMEIQQEKHDQFVAAVGGTFKGSTGRAYILRWLEFGTRPHAVVAGAPGRRDARRAIRALRSVNRPETAARLRRSIREGSVTFKRALKLPGGVLRASAQHPGTRSQSPLTRALVEQGDRALKVFGQTTWAGIRAWVPVIRAGG